MSRIARTPRSEWPVMVAISASVHSGECEPGHCRAAQVIECYADDASRLACLAPRRPKAVRGPRLAVAVGEDDRCCASAWHRARLKRRTDPDDDARTRLPLPQTDVRPVVGATTAGEAGRLAAVRSTARAVAPDVDAPAHRLRMRPHPQRSRFSRTRAARYSRPPRSHKDWQR